MITFRKMLLGLSGATLAFAPVAVQATESTQKISMAEYQQARSGALVADENQLNGGNHALGLIMLAAVAAGMVYVLYEIIEGGDDDQPTSP